MFKFFDISSNNFPLEDGNDCLTAFTKAKEAGFGGLIAKATQGTSYKNPYLEEIAAAAEELNKSDSPFHLGYYYYGDPTEGTGSENAEYCYEVIKNLPRDLGVSLDLEKTGGKPWTLLEVWAKEALEFYSEKNIGSPVYLNKEFLDNLPTAPFNHKLWYSYPSGLAIPRMKLWAWQNSFSGYVAGVGTADCDIYIGE